ncbi:MAG: hypothetical protein CSYNP_03361 [Syntrophus sp. SKADARSKE-3]|nr:hypothetical protein [Syntrophus sp. SKADARSKE-3]
MKKLFVCLLMAYYSALLGCGGGSTSTGTPAAPSMTVSGIAATGEPITGTVYLKDSSAQEFSVPIGTDGTYSLDVTNLTAPFILKAVGTASGENCILYSLANEPGIANINPLSHLSVVQANSGSDPSSLYANLTASQLQAINTELATVIPQIQALLQPVLSQYGVSTKNFITDPYTIDHTGLDLLHDTITIHVNGGNLVMTNKATGATILNTSLNGKPLSGQISTSDIPAISTQPTGAVFVYPVSSTILTGGTVPLKSIIKGTNSQAVIWSVVDTNGGSITSTGLFTAPSSAGTYHVLATSAADSTKSARATVRVILPNYINLQSDYGDYIGGGRTYNYTNSNAKIVVSANRGYLSISIDGDENWNGDFQCPSYLTQLQSGTYSNLQRYPIYKPGLSWSGEGRASNTLTGWFTIENVIYVNGTLTEVDLNFEQHNEGGVPALYGQIHWSTADKTAPMGPVYPAPAGLWQAASGSTPSNGNYVYLQSEGEYVGGGRTYSYTNANAQIAVNATGGHLNVRVNNNQDDWWGDFQAMISLNQLQPGYYGSLMRYPFHNPAKGGLSWGGNGRGCNTLTGWFVVDNATYANGILSAVDLRFEQHCEGRISSLHGQIHWSQ